MTIFKQLYELAQESPLKTQTRRVVKPGERVMFTDGELMPPAEYMVWKGYFIRELAATITPNNRIKQQVGRDYAIVPKRGLKSIGRYKLLSIRVERVQDISEEDAIAEGFYLSKYSHYVTSVLPLEGFKTAREGYIRLWGSINTIKPYRWQDNPLVFVYGIQVLTIQAESAAA